MSSWHPKWCQTKRFSEESYLNEFRDASKRDNVYASNVIIEPWKRVTATAYPKLLLPLQKALYVSDMRLPSLQMEVSLPLTLSLDPLIIQKVNSEDDWAAANHGQNLRKMHLQDDARRGTLEMVQSMFQDLLKEFSSTFSDDDARREIRDMFTEEVAEKILLKVIRRGQPLDGSQKASLRLTDCSWPDMGSISKSNLFATKTIDATLQLKFELNLSEEAYMEEDGKDLAIANKNLTSKLLRILDPEETNFAEARKGDAREHAVAIASAVRDMFGVIWGNSSVVQSSSVAMRSKEIPVTISSGKGEFITRKSVFFVTLIEAARFGAHLQALEKRIEHKRDRYVARTVSLGTLDPASNISLEASFPPLSS